MEGVGGDVNGSHCGSGRASALSSRASTPSSSVHWVTPPSSCGESSECEPFDESTLAFFVDEPTPIGDETSDVTRELASQLQALTIQLATIQKTSDRLAVLMASENRNVDSPEAYRVMRPVLRAVYVNTAQLLHTLRSLKELRVVSDACAHFVM